MSALSRAGHVWAHELLGQRPERPQAPHPAEGPEPRAEQRPKPGGARSASSAESPRYRLQTLSERLVYAPYHRTRIVRVRLALWSAAGVACLAPSGRLRYPSDPDPLCGAPPPARPPRPRGNPPRATRFALAAAAELHAEAEVRARSWQLDERGLWFWLERSAPMERISLDLDPIDHSRLGFDAPFRLAGSTFSASLLRARAVERAREQIPQLPRESEVVYARCYYRKDRQERVWYLRFLATAGERRGRTRAVLNARTGAICELSSDTHPARDPVDESDPAQEHARGALLERLRPRLGRRVVLGPLVSGRRGESPTWMGVAVDAAGMRWRATLCEGELDLGPLAQQAAG